MKKYLFLGTLALLLVVATSVLAQNGLPGGGWTSGQQIQNVGSSDATVQFNAYATDGTSYDCGSQVLAVGGSYTYLTNVDCPVPSGFQGSAVVSSDQPIAAVTNVNNKGTGAASGQYVGTNGGSIATTVAFPLIKNNHSNRTSTFYIQNASSNLNDITATFSVNGTDYPKTYSDVPANAMVVITPSDAGVPSGQGNVGGLTVTGTEPLAGTSLEHETAPAVANNLQASRGFVPGDYDTAVACPLVRYSAGSKQTTTGVQAQNVGTEAIDITITYSVVTGSTINPTATVTNVQPGESANFLQATDLNAKTVASATVTAVANDGTPDSATSVAVAAIVNDKAFATTPQRVTTYACFGTTNTATDSINLPLVKEDFGGSVVNTTGIQIQNVGNANTTLTLTYTPSGGTPVVITHSDPIAPGASKTFYRVGNSGTANISATSGSLASLNKTLNGVVVTSSGNVPIVAIANESSLSGAIQDTKNYEGFNQ
ncbi:MAG: hypothetical protein DWQ04_20915 [Chloroflexi bacterium]|nr:MAG: hypothetical protein DWQ04_20915 [Chloroflexota bacterium]